MRICLLKIYTLVPSESLNDSFLKLEGGMYMVTSMYGIG